MVVPLPVDKTEHALIEFEEDRSKEEILKLCEEQHPNLFPDLWAGDFEGHTSDQSDADHWLICMLRDNCHSNEMVAELFAESGLYREEKWNGRTRDYVFHSLENSATVAALSLLTEIPEDPEDPSPPKKKKHAGWSWESVSDVGEWVAEDDHYIIKRLLHEGTTTCVFGAPGSGKTFCVFSMCAAVASGRDWRGYKVRQGGVLYFGLEGRHGVKKRIQAMKKEEQLKDGDPFASVLCAEDSLNLLSGEHVDKVCETIKSFEKESGHRCKIIVVDTLARATPGGDENSTKDMGQVLIHAQAIADRTGCCVLIIHHSGKDTSRGMRGSTALPGGFDSIFRVTRHDDEPSIRIFHIEKQRDEADAGDIYFRLEIVTLGVDEDLEPVTTCLLRFVEDCEIPVKKEKGQIEADQILTHIPKEGINFLDLLKATGLARSTLQRRLLALTGEYSLHKDEAGLYFNMFDDLND
jgi:hypothetical protein